MTQKVSITIDSGQKCPDYFDLDKIQGIKDYCLGSKYELSVVFTSSQKIQELNSSYRNKNTPTDILSFPLNENEGEIFFCMNEVEKEAEKFDRKVDNFLIFLFIHGCVHLKGYDHGSKMEEIETEIRKKFQV